MEIKLEEAFKELEDVIAQMEQTDVGLEQSFDLYNKGVKLIQACNNKIDKVEKEIQMINNDGGNV